MHWRDMNPQRLALEQAQLTRPCSVTAKCSLHGMLCMTGCIPDVRICCMSELFSTQFIVVPVAPPSSKFSLGSLSHPPPARFDSQERTPPNPHIPAPPHEFALFMPAVAEEGKRDHRDASSSSPFPLFSQIAVEEEQASARLHTLQAQEEEKRFACHPVPTGVHVSTLLAASHPPSEYLRGKSSILHTFHFLSPHFPRLAFHINAHPTPLWVWKSVRRPPPAVASRVFCSFVQGCVQSALQQCGTASS